MRGSGYRSVMTAEPPTPPDTRRQDAGHLDEDPEALEDPVHRGDAQHQHELHENPSGRTG